MIFIDEGGFTGPDLFSTEQSVFTLASLNLSDEEAQRLRAVHFGRSRARELKHTQLSKRPNGRKQVLSFLNELCSEPAVCKFALIHKRFALVCKMVDLLIEPSMRSLGYSAYEDRFNVALSNITWFSLRAAAPSGLFENILCAFQEFIRQPSPIRLAHLQQQLSPSTGIELIDRLLTMFYLSSLHIAPHLLRESSADDFDLVLTCSLEIMAAWRSVLEGPIHVIHDTSAPMRRFRKAWDVLGGTPPVTSIGGAEPVRYPLLIDSTTAMVSHSSAGLQLVDILAGCITSVYRAAVNEASASDEYVAQILEILGEMPPVSQNWPEPRFSPEEFESDGIDAEAVLEESINLLHANDPLGGS